MPELPWTITGILIGIFVVVIIYALTRNRPGRRTRHPRNTSGSRQ